ncbi:DUF481 domain-containing protein [Winogradskyella sp.]|jgi:hypothetical protein|uniref:DUF481 domain-containing protein n=1 Tax=Winogradskyella sp. TaxID=1883156 RepID=UPI0025F8BD34|nr:DUF481 domain-containing protein [Winogradskyella sp.]MCT4630238.1 DUF481 domain-containing protein [Winogradskyella sp.]
MNWLKFILFFISTSCFAQVINVESLRKPSDTTKWTGSVSLDVSLIRNTNDIFRIKNKAHIQYDNSTNFWLFVNDINLQKIEDNSLVNRGTQHIRYNRKISNSIKWEAFAQGQYDAISEIGFRGLIGTGPRFKLTNNDNYKFYLGSLIMYEYEKASSSIPDRTQKDIRGSAYLSFSIYPTETLSVISTSYYQPKIDTFSDYRFSSNTSLLFKIYKNLAFKTNFNFFHDEFPVSSSVSKTQFELTNGLLYTF